MSEITDVFEALLSGELQDANIQWAHMPDSDTTAILMSLTDGSLFLVTIHKAKIEMQK